MGGREERERKELEKLIKFSTTKKRLIFKDLPHIKNTHKNKKLIKPVYLSIFWGILIFLWDRLRGHPRSKKGASK
jgi:hypothetical protein